MITGMESREPNVRPKQIPLTTRSELVRSIGSAVRNYEGMQSVRSVGVKTVDVLSFVFETRNECQTDKSI